MVIRVLADRTGKTVSLEWAKKTATLILARPTSAGQNPERFNRRVLMLDNNVERWLPDPGAAALPETGELDEGTDPIVPQQPASPEQQAAQLRTQLTATEQNSMTPLFSAAAPPVPRGRRRLPGRGASGRDQDPRRVHRDSGPRQLRLSPDTPNVWSAAEWNQYAEPDPDLRLLPIYVHNYADGQPEVDAANAGGGGGRAGLVAGAAGRGRTHHRDRRRNADRLRVLSAAMGETIQRAHFPPGDLRVGGDGARQPLVPAGYFMADYNNAHAPTALSPGVLGMQWKPGPPWDFSVFSQDMYFGCGHG